MTENEKNFGKWVTENKKALAALYFDYFEHNMKAQMDGDTESDPLPLDLFVMKIYEDGQDLVAMHNAKEASSAFEAGLSNTDFSRN
tara:strand:+ start:562 stop:819 length:258 start_codon:yes stop_codon:yes gene_type:complete